MITNASPDFTPDDVSRWRAFLETPTGMRLLPKLVESAPALLDGKDVNQTLVRNGELRGFQLAVRELLNLTEIPQVLTTPTDAYPPLDDDTKWKSE